MSNVSSSNGLEKYPKLRFKGFSEPWNSISFGELFAYLPNNTLSRAELNYESGEYQNVHYGDVLIKFGPVLDAATDILPFITDHGSEKPLNRNFGYFSRPLLEDTFDIIIPPPRQRENQDRVRQNKA